MEYAISALGIALFLLGFFIGLWIGFKASKGQIPRTPVEAVKVAKEIKKYQEQLQQEDKEMQETEEFFASGGYLPEERARMRVDDD